MATKSGTNGDDNLAGTAGTDTLKGLGGNDFLAGLAGNDRLEGGAGNDFISGAGGHDVVAGGAGADQMDGGSGVDTLDYSASTGGVLVDLGGGFVQADGQTETFKGFENVIGSANRDNLVGSNAANVLSGGAGNDFISGAGGNDVVAGGTGADILNGGDGVDALDYSGSAESVTVSLFGGFGQGGDAEGDSILEIENLIGSAHGDLLGGSAVANSLKGGAGGDELFGALGRDELTGGAGADFFFYGNTTDSGVTAATRDLIRDFNHGQGDKLAFALEDAGGIDLTFEGQNGFTAAGQVRFFFEGDHTVVAVNTVGTSGAEMQIELAGRVSLAASDFDFDL